MLNTLCFKITQAPKQSCLGEVNWGLGISKVTLKA